MTSIGARGQRRAGPRPPDPELMALQAANAALSAQVAGLRSGLDPVTGLPTREALERSVQAALAAGRHPTVLIVSLSGLDVVHQQLGRAAADELVRRCAVAVTRVVRGGDVVVGLGADLGVHLVEPTGSDREPTFTDIARRVLAAATQAAQSLEVTRQPAVVAGLVALAEGGTAADVLLDADLALAEARLLGQDLVEYQPRMRTELNARLSLEHDLGQALAAGQFRVAYQPLVDLHNGSLIGYEALLRWHHPVRGLVPPDVFIPLAESSGHIDVLGDWVLDEALRQLRVWQHRDGLATLTMAVNLSPRQLEDPQLPTRVRTSLYRSGVNPGTVTLEVTESLAMAEGAPAEERLWQLKALGVQIALDDFGTGHSSLGRLASLPIDKVKIDRSFVSPLVPGRQDSRRRATLLSAAVAMARGLGLLVVAEGVETDDHLSLLRALDCQQAQGYHFGRPAEADHHRPGASSWLLPEPDDRLLRADVEAVADVPTVYPLPPSALAPPLPHHRRQDQPGWPTLHSSRYLN